MLITADFGGGSASPSSTGSQSMTVEVDADRLLATAQQLEATATQLGEWLDNHDDDLTVQAAGSDAVSTGVAEFFTETWSGAQGGRVQVRAAAANLLSFAATMRGAAASYGLTDTTTAANLGSQA